MSNQRTAIVVLGAAVRANGPSHNLRRRTAHAAELYHTGVAEFVLCCGGLGQHPPAEAEAMAELLRSASVPDAAILLEDTSRNTSQNLRYAAKILAERGINDVILVSDAYHLPRAKLLARREGLSPLVSAPDLSGVRLGLRIKWRLREIPAILAVLLGLR